MLPRFLRRQTTPSLANIAQIPEPQKTFRNTQSGLREGIYRIAYEMPELSSEVLCITKFYLAVYPTIDDKTTTVLLEFQKVGEYLPLKLEMKTHHQSLGSITPEEIAQAYPQIRKERDVIVTYRPVLLYQDTVDKMINWWN